MFKPIYILTGKLTSLLVKIDLLKRKMIDLPITPKILISLRKSARLNTIHYSTQIEGNKLTVDEIKKIIKLESSSPKKILHIKKRDEKEVLGYHAALEQIKDYSNKNKPLTEEQIKTIHALVIGKKGIKPTPYRDGQNAIYDGNTKKIVYLPPEAHDVPKLMNELTKWIYKAEKNDLPTPLIAAITHYQLTTIHPYYDGNGRTARLLATLVLHRGGYDLNGLYSLEEYYAKELNAYYNAISIGPSHNYYIGRAETDITSWLIYFCLGMLDSFEKVKTHALIAYNESNKKSLKNKSNILRSLDSKQKAVLSLFEKNKIITSNNIATFFNVSKRTARTICQKWVSEGFFIINDPAKKSRKYELNEKLNKLLFE